MYIICFLNNCNPGRFWSESDLELLEGVFTVAKEYKIPLNVDAVPEVFKEKSSASALISAVRKSNFELVKLLIKNGANIFLEDEQKKSAYDYAEENYKKLIDDVKSLKERGLLDQAKKAFQEKNLASLKSVLQILLDKYPNFCGGDAFFKLIKNVNLNEKPEDFDFKSSFNLMAAF